MDDKTAAARNLTFAQGNHFVMRADSTTVLHSGGPGRNSVRLHSHETYTTSVMV